MSLQIAAGEDPVYAERIEIAGHRFRVDLALDDPSRMRGLMFRTAMPVDAGMLFVFDSPGPLAFWMRNTKIALDILYFDGDGRLLSIQAQVPPCKTAQCPSYPSVGDAQYVVELNAGEAERLGLKAGDSLCTHVAVLDHPPRCRVED